MPALDAFKQVASAIWLQISPHERLARDIRDTIDRLVQRQGLLEPAQAEHLLAALTYGRIDVFDVADLEVRRWRECGATARFGNATSRRADAELTARVIDEVERFAPLRKRVLPR